MWEFIQNQILSMAWLSHIIQVALLKLGVDTEEKFGGSLHFFLYDTIKITLLLFVLIFVISYIQSYFPPERSKKIMGRFSGMRARILAALLGTVTPFCSCSSIPIFMGFTQAGLPLGVTFSFLISSPMVDLGSLVLLTSIFGWKIALAYVLLGLLIAILGGTFIEHVHLENEVASFIRNSANASASLEIKLSQKERFAESFSSVKETLKKVFPYILLGVSIGAFIHNWIPETWITRVLGENNPLGVAMATILGAPMYADIFGCIPIAESLLAKGALLGVVLSFMMSVTTLSIPSLVMLKQVISAKLLFVFAGVCVLGIVIVGYVFNFLQSFLI